MSKKLFTVGRPKTIVEPHKNILIHVNFMLIHVIITDRQKDKHIKSIARNLIK